LLVLGISLFILSKAADALVDNAVELSKIVGIPEIIIGATIVSLGTTLPELSASATSALHGNGDFALGNAVGSIITNTSLILGIGALFGKIPVDKRSSQKFNLLIIAVFLLIIPTIPYKIHGNEGLIPQGMGIAFLLLVPIYIFFLLNQEKKKNKSNLNNRKREPFLSSKSSPLFFLGKIVVAAVLIGLSASLLVDSAEVLAVRVGIPDVIIAATLVAFGTSVPELSTCIAAAKSNHGGLALGNIMGANILNVLLVTGASAVLSPEGIIVSRDFYNIHFIALGVILSVFAYFSYNYRFNEISKKEGIFLILIYIFYVGANLFTMV